MARRPNMKDRKYDVEIGTLNRLCTAFELDGRISQQDREQGQDAIKIVIALIRKIRAFDATPT